MILSFDSTIQNDISRIKLIECAAQLDTEKELLELVKKYMELAKAVKAASFLAEDEKQKYLVSLVNNVEDLIK